MICAEIVLKLKKKYKNVMLECAIPCLSQEKKWSLLEQKRYKKIIRKADVVHYVSKKEYTDTCMNDRNNYMVNECDVVIAVWNGSPSGTGNTVKMARNTGKKVRIVEPFDPS